jgi:hypothetical protein
MRTGASERITGYSELTFAPRLRLLTGDMEAAGHEEEVTLKTRTQHDKIRPAPARSRTHAKTAVLNSLTGHSAPAAAIATPSKSSSTGTVQNPD